MKTQMKFQKWLCFAMLILGALAVVLALTYCTGGLAGLGATVQLKAGTPTFRYGDAAQVYLDVQSFNDMLLYLSIVLVLLAVVLYITATNKRRNYYVTNYVATGVVCVGSIAISVYCLIENGIFHSRFINEVLNNETFMTAWRNSTSEKVQLAYSESTVMFILAYILFAVIIVASILLIVNLIWKMKLMKGEKALLDNGLAKEVA